jgi:predicted DNA-binding protein
VTAIRLPPEILVGLDALARKNGVARSYVIREILRIGLGAASKKDPLRGRGQ